MSLAVSLSFEQKVAYAERSLAVDLQKDSRGLVNFVQLMLGKPLPEAWRQCFDEHWRLFFYNEKTKTSAWSHPLRSAHQHLVDAYRRLEVAPSPGAIEREVKRCRELAEEELRQWGEAEADGRTFYVHLETRQSSWENPYELIMANLSLEVEMLREAFDLEPADSPRGSPAICSVQSWRESEASEELAERPVEEAEELRSQALLRAVAQRWLCQRSLLQRRQGSALRLLQAHCRSWLCQHHLFELEGIESSYSSDYEAESSRCSAPGHLSFEELAEEVDGALGSAGSLAGDGPRSRWEGVGSPHWRRLTELPAFQLPKIEAPSTQRLEADSFVQGLGSDSKGFEHLLEVARAQLPKKPTAAQEVTSALPARRKLRRVELRSQEPQAVTRTRGPEAKASPAKPLKRAEARKQRPADRWERRVLQSLPSHQAPCDGPGYAGKQLLKSAEKARELRKVLRKDHHQVCEAYSNVFQQLKLLDQMRRPRPSQAKARCKQKA